MASTCVDGEVSTKPPVIVISSTSDSEESDPETQEALLLPVSPEKKVFTPTKR